MYAFILLTCKYMAPSLDTCTVKFMLIDVFVLRLTVFVRDDVVNNGVFVVHSISSDIHGWFGYSLRLSVKNRYRFTCVFRPFHVC